MTSKTRFLALTFLISSFSFGQNTFPATGNVGIGTTTPTGSLDIMGPYIDVSLDANSPATVNFRTPGHVQLAVSTALNPPYTTSLQSKHTTYNGYAYPIALNPLGGNVGIGTSTPNSKLSIKGSGTGVSISPGGSPYFGTIAFNREAGTGEIFDTSAQAFQINNGGNDKNLHFQIYNGNGSQITDNALVIKGTNGFIGIGTANPDYALTVNGTIHSKEVIVDTNITPDYVFQKYYTGKSTLKSDYVMPTLAEIERFAKLNNHLPNVPSAQEVQQKGLSLGEMSNVLLQKVEELTLYAIEQQKEIERLKTENEQYKSLAERLATIENLLKK